LSREIKVTVRGRGKVELDFGGFPGAECLDEAAQLEAALKALGLRLRLSDQRLKPEAAGAGAGLESDEPSGSGVSLS